MKPMVQSVLTNKGKPGFIWQMMNGGSGIWADVAGYTGTGKWSVSSQQDCAATMRDACRADSKQQTGALNYVPPTNKSLAWSGQTLAFRDFEEHLAAFLRARREQAALARVLTRTCATCCSCVGLQLLSLCCRARCEVMRGPRELWTLLLPCAFGRDSALSAR